VSLMYITNRLQLYVLFMAQ